MNETAERHQQIAKTIIDQINAVGPAFPRITQLIGMKQPVFLREESLIVEGQAIDGGLMFMLPYKYKIIVELCLNDTYRVSLGKISGVDYRTIQTVEDVYCDTLGHVVHDLATHKKY